MVSGQLGGIGSEREVLTGFLDWYRGVVIAKVDDLPLGDAIATATPSGLSPLGIVKHLASVERTWFRWRFAGEDVAVADDAATTFGIDPRDSVAASARSAPLYGNVSLRWTLVHLIEETARHAGHLDIIRERIDGRTGD